MLNRLRHTSSLGNLSRPQHLRSQVATILILIIVAMLVFIMITLNLGKIATTTTRISTAADESALFLASQLSTKAHYLWEALGKRIKKCKKKRFGFLSIVLAIVVAVVAVHFAPAEYAVLAGTIGGTAGGGLGAAIEGTDIMSGMMMGALIGVSVGSIYGHFNPVLQTNPELWPVPGGEASPYLLHVSFKTMVMTTLGAAASVYNTYIADKEFEKALSKIAKMLNGEREEDRYRESVMYRAFSRVVDDPNTSADIYDLNYNGDTSEKVSAFDIWFYQRSKQIKAVVDKILNSGLIANFKQLMLSFSFYIRGLLTKSTAFMGLDWGIEGGGYSEGWNSGSGALARQEVEGADGIVTAVLRALHEAGQDVSFWAPGPSQGALSAWENQPCTDSGCPLPPAGYDAVDDLINELDSLELLLLGTDRDGLAYQGDYKLAVSSGWYDAIYSEEDKDDTYYHTLKKFSQTINNEWIGEIRAKEESLPLCQFDIDSEGNIVGVLNPPCYCPAGQGGGLAAHGGFGSINYDLFDEFKAARQELAQIAGKMNDFADSSRDYIIDLGKYSPANVNPATYTWSDSRGAHSVKVTVSDFKIPHIRKKKRHRKICLILKDYQDDGSHTWVEIVRSDPGLKEVSSGSGFHISGQAGKSLAIKRRASASYTFLGRGHESSGKVWQIKLKSVE